MMLLITCAAVATWWFFGYYGGKVTELQVRRIRNGIPGLVESEVLAQLGRPYRRNRVKGGELLHYQIFDPIDDNNVGAVSIFVDEITRKVDIWEHQYRGKPVL
jgi:hypothetical protein